MSASRGPRPVERRVRPGMDVLAQVLHSDPEWPLVREAVHQYATQALDEHADAEDAHFAFRRRWGYARRFTRVFAEARSQHPWHAST